MQARTSRRTPPSRACVKSVPAEGRPAVSVDRPDTSPRRFARPDVHLELLRAPRGLHRVAGLLRRMGAFALVELQKLSHDRSELITRMVQPALWLLIFGQTFSRLHVINTGDVSYLAFLAPGIIAQSALFISIFYGIQIVWDRDAGILAKLMVTPAPASALITGKAFA